MKARKAHNAAGICAEMLTVDCPLLHEINVEVFNEVLKARQDPPLEWQSSRLVVFFKKGDPALPSNYRPIAISPIQVVKQDALWKGEAYCTIVGH